MFLITKNMKKLYCINWSMYRKFGKPKILVLLKKDYFSSFIFSSKFKNADKKILTEQESFEALKFLVYLII